MKMKKKTINNGNEKKKNRSEKQLHQIKSTHFTVNEKKKLIIEKLKV